VHEVQIHIRRLQQIEALLQALLRACVERAPQLARDEEVLSLHDPARDDILQRLAHLILILVAERTVNVSVAALDGVDDRLLDLSRRRLPRTQSQRRDRGSGVQRNRSVHSGRRSEDVFRGELEKEVCERGASW
jgi:hypothetical protein